MKTTKPTNTLQKGSSQSNRGFTLIELLIVIAVLGVLATVLLVAINPLEQIARGRDSGRIGDVSQLAHAVQAYATANGSATYPTENTTWQDTLLASGDIQSNVIPPATNTTLCAPATGSGAIENNVCYHVTGTGPSAVFYVWTALESKSSNQKSVNGATAGCVSKVVVAVYDSSQGKAGVTCMASNTTYPSGLTLY